MKRVLITGGTGGLGQELGPRLREAGYAIRIASRRSRKPNTPEAIEWAQMSLEDGTGITEALVDVDVLIHAASSPFGKTQAVDIEGTRQLLAHGKKANLAHFFYISIVGVDRIPFSYYQAKYAAEQLIEKSDVPYTILRAPQFHSLLDQLFSMMRWMPVMLLPTDLPFQPIDTGEVAEHMVELVQAGASGRVPDIGGPEVLRLGDLVQGWKQARGMYRPVVRLPLPGQTAKAFRQGFNTTPDNRYGKITWSEWLDEKYAHA